MSGGICLSQLQNAYTNRANTANLNSIYPQFDTTPETGGIIDITDPKAFYADPNAAVDQASYDKQYAATIEMLRKNEVPESQWPKYNNPALNPSKSNNTWAQQNAGAITNSGYQGGNPSAAYGRETRKRNRILKKGGQLRNWFSPLRGN